MNKQKAAAQLSGMLKEVEGMHRFAGRGEIYGGIQRLYTIAAQYACSPNECNFFVKQGRALVERAAVMHRQIEAKKEKQSPKFKRG
jgi:hypothetical protein